MFDNGWPRYSLMCLRRTGSKNLKISNYIKLEQVTARLASNLGALLTLTAALVTDIEKDVN
jgi:hypothetical protein